MTYKEALFFIGKCLTITHEAANKVAIEKVLQNETVDWDTIVKVSTSHYVFPALYLNLQRADFLSYLPEDLVRYMAHITDLNRERNEQIIDQAKEINELLLDNGITPIFLKGTGNLLEGLYQDIGERMVGDIDFIVDKGHFLKAANMLEANGYISKKNINIGMHWHYPGLIHPEKIASVEVHQKILKDDYQHSLGINLFKEVIVLEYKIHVLSIQNKHLATTLPKIINDNLYAYKNISLRNAYDVYLFSLIDPINTEAINNSKIKQKVNNYLSCMKWIFANTEVIKVIENQKSQKYRISFEKLIEGNQNEKKKIKAISCIIKIKKRIYIITKSFSNTAYRKFVFKRIKQKSFWKKMVGLSNV